MTTSTRGRRRSRAAAAPPARPCRRPALACACRKARSASNTSGCTIASRRSKSRGLGQQRRGELLAVDLAAGGRAGECRLDSGHGGVPRRACALRHRHRTRQCPAPAGAPQRVDLPMPIEPVRPMTSISGPRCRRPAGRAARPSPAGARRTISRSRARPGAAACRGRRR